MQFIVCGEGKKPVHLYTYSSTFTCTLDTLYSDCTLFLTSLMHLSNAFYCWTQAFQINLFNKVTGELQLTSENVLGCFSVTNCWLLVVLLQLVVESDVPNSKCAKWVSLFYDINSCKIQRGGMKSADIVTIVVEQRGQIAARWVNLVHRPHPVKRWVSSDWQDSPLFIKSSVVACLSFTDTQI